MEGASYQRFPRVKIREMKDDYLKFELRAAPTPAWPNALRRVTIAEGPHHRHRPRRDRPPPWRHPPSTSERAMSMRFSRDCDACDGDGQCEFCSVEFHLRARCMTGQTLDVTSKDLISSDHTVVPVDFSDALGDDSSEQKGITIVKLRRGQELRL